MWKRFNYKGSERVAWVAEQGPAFQVLDAGKPAKGFRSFKPDQMEDVRPAENHYGMIPTETVLKYDELLRAQLP